jgi:hypothetical protein
MPCNLIAAHLLPVGAASVVVAGAGSPSGPRVRVRASRVLDRLLHRLRVLLLLPKLLLHLVLLRLRRRKLPHCHCTAGEGGRVVVRALRSAASRIRRRLIGPVGPLPPSACCCLLSCCALRRNTISSPWSHHLEFHVGAVSSRGVLLTTIVGHFRLSFGDLL